MAEGPVIPPAPAAPIQLESGTYEIIRQRLQQCGQELSEQLGRLNTARKEVFGAIDTTLVATEHITTPNNCIPWNIVSVGHNRFLFGFNVYIGLKSQTAVSDVFAAYEKKGHTFQALPLELIANRDFETDFRELYRYYRNPLFVKFTVQGPFLFMIFRVGANLTDVKTFKWLIQDGPLAYLGNRSDHELSPPPQHEFEWKRTHRDLHRAGQHPHISIEDRVFVETIGGDLTVKVEDNTATGAGIYSEPVEHRDQTLDDAEIFYALVGNLVLLKIRPYQEDRFRYLVYNGKLQQVHRIDAIEDACVLLPHDQGIVFANGYYLQLGEFKQFPTGLVHMTFEARLPAPNGEDHLFTFYNRLDGLYVLMSYNMIEQRIESPILCNGYCLFENGEMALFRAPHEPQKHHTLQIWQTPFFDSSLSPQERKDNYLYKLGNATIVRCMSECYEILTLLQKDDRYADLFVDVVKSTTDALDSYFWLDRPEAFNLRATLEAIREAAAGAIGEFDKVRRLRRNAQAEFDRVTRKTRDFIEATALGPFEHIDPFVNRLAGLRGLRGELVALKEMRYVEVPAVEALEKEVADRQETLSRQCVEFLLQPQALEPYQAKVKAHEAASPTLGKVAEIRQEEAAVQKTAAELDLLIETVSNLKIEDPTQTTRIIDAISAVYAALNQVRGSLKRRRQDLQKVEGAAQFSAQLRLLEQSVANYLEISDTPERCEQYLNKLMVQVEELEGQFADLEEFQLQLAEKREEVYAAFESRKLALVEARARQANAIMVAADRILKGVQHRGQQLDSIQDIHGYFAGDLMVNRIRTLAQQLLDLNDTVKAGNLQARLKTLREDAVRQLKDRQELFVQGQPVIHLGKHRFTVNSQKLELTIVPHESELCFHLNGTNYFEALADPDLASARAVWNQEHVSENRQVYRGEYLAFQILRRLESGGPLPVGAAPPDANGMPRSREAPAGAEPPPARSLSSGTLAEAAGWTEAERLAFARQFMAARYAEGYVKGLHDADAARILQPLLQMQHTIGLLRYHARARACAAAFWHYHQDKLPILAAKLEGFRIRKGLFPGRESQAQYVAELQMLIQEFNRQSGLFPEILADEAGEYLFYDLTSHSQFIISQEAAHIHQSFLRHLTRKVYQPQLDEALRAVSGDPRSAIQLLRDWIGGFLAATPGIGSEEYLDEAAVLLLRQGYNSDAVVDARVNAEIPGMTGSHPILANQTYSLNYNAFMQKLRAYEREVVPMFQKFQERKNALLARKRESLRLDVFQPRVLTSFVRNRLINQVYLPLIGDNLAKQIGVAGEETRTDRMGLLLLVSPPGYGKTTLMEYVASRLGLTFVKINGPALGGQVTSLDPSEARHASAREELGKLNLAFEMGDNLMIYLDDIQHCHAELLQKFIPLCDAQRRIEGVHQGRARTYDLRGRKVAVVMAGNPYTESGERFQIPDMLANRADTYNLGDIIANTEQAFKESYLENALTSNPVLSKLSSRGQKDVTALIKLASGESRDSVAFEGNYSIEEINELAAVMRKLIRIRDAVLRVNQEYIRSAAQAEAYRTEPPFKLQGSYRNMNRLAEHIVPIMNDAEVQALILDHYQNEAQTLARDTEANLLKLKEIFGLLTPGESQRWEEIKRTFKRNLLFHEAGGQDPVGRVVAQLATFSEGLESIRSVLAHSLPPPNAPKDKTQPPTEQWLQQIGAELPSLSQKLEAIQSVLNEGMKRLAARPARSEDAAAKLAASLQTPISQLSEGLEAIRSILASGLQWQQKQPTLRVLNPANKADYEITSVTQETLRKIWALIEEERKPRTEAPNRPPNPPP